MKIIRVIIILVITIPLLATDIDNEIAENITIAENDVHPDEKKHAPLVSVEKGNDTRVVENANANLTRLHRNETEDIRIGRKVEQQPGVTSLAEKSSSSLQNDQKTIEEELGTGGLNSTVGKKVDDMSIQNDTLIQNNPDTKSSPNATAETLDVNEEGDSSQKQKKDGESIKANSTAADPETDPVIASNQNDGKPTKLDEDDFKLRGRVAVDYASKSAGALVIEKSGSFKGTSNLLNGDKDKYAIAPCEEKKMVVVSLSEDILVKEIKLANYERFSSTAKEFQVMGSQTMDTWVDLGTYHAEPGNGEQKFELLEPAWARYLKFTFLSHHGVEYYCTYSQIKVHGSTMVQGFHEQWEENEDKTEKEEDIKKATDISAKDEMFFENETLASLKSDENHIRNEKRAIQNRTNPGVTEIPSVSELSMPTSLEYMLQGMLSSDDSTDRGHEPSEKLVFYRARASVMASSKRVTLEPLDLSTSNGLVHSTLQSNYKRDYHIQFNAPKMSADMKQTLSMLLAKANKEPNNKYITHLLSLPTSGGQQDKQKDIEQKNIRPFNVSEEPCLIAEDKGINKQGEKKTIPLGTQDDKESDTKVSSELNAGAALSSSRLQISTPSNQLDSSEGHTELDMLLAKLLVGLPSSDCLTKLDFADFKAKAHRKDHAGSGSPNVGSMEPIFKKLTDEIKSLQINLSTQEQFTKVSVACYQRVLLDLMSENEKTRREHDLRLSKLELELHSSEAFAWRLVRSMSSMVSVLYSFVREWGVVLIDCWLEIWSWVLMASFYALISGLKFSAQLWPPVKQFLSAFGPLYPDIIPPLVESIDNILKHFELRWSLVHLPPLSRFSVDFIKFATLQCLAAVLVFSILNHLKVNLSLTNVVTSTTENEESRTKNGLPVVSPEKDIKQ